MSMRLAYLMPLFFCACVDEAKDEMSSTPMELNLPLGFPEPVLREDNPFSRESVELGRLLFKEQRLSANGTQSCASCHIAEMGFADGHKVSPGTGSALGFRNTPAITNLAYHEAFFMDGGALDLEIQLLAPIHAEEEMGGNIHETAEEIKTEEPYRTLSERAYGRELDGYVISRAIANYERSLISGNSRFDKWLHAGDKEALSDSERSGWQLFSSERLNCTACHSGFLFTDKSYQNIGLYAEYEDIGRGRISNDERDNGKFKVPSLRDVTKTAPYMHDGSMASLGEVLDHFASGGVGHVNQSSEIHVISLSESEKEDLIAFLGSLEGDVVGVESVLK